MSGKETFDKDTFEGLRDIYLLQFYELLKDESLTINELVRKEAPFLIKVIDRCSQHMEVSSRSRSSIKDPLNVCIYISNSSWSLWNGISYNNPVSRLGDGTII